MLIPRITSAPLPTGLVLSGGGFKGGFQIGAMQNLIKKRPELFENVVSIGGSSIGGINALGLGIFLSRGFDFAESLNQLENFWTIAAEKSLLSYNASGVIKTIGKKLLQPFFKFSIGSDSIYKAQPIENVLKDLLGTDLNLTIGELQKKINMHLFITGTCVETDSTEVFGGGVKVIDAMMATGALPGGFPVRKINGKNYADGGIYQNTPLKYVVNPESNGLPEVTRVISLFLDPKPVYDEPLKKYQRLAANAFDALTNVLNNLHTRVSYEEFKEALRINEHLTNYLTDLADIENYRELLKNKSLSKNRRQKYELALQKNIENVEMLNGRYHLLLPGRRPKRFITFINLFPWKEMDTLDESTEAMKENTRRGLAGEYLLEEIR